MCKAGSKGLRVGLEHQGRRSPAWEAEVGGEKEEGMKLKGAM